MLRILKKWLVMRVQHVEILRLAIEMIAHLRPLYNLESICNIPATTITKIISYVIKNNIKSLINSLTNSYFQLPSSK